jgi:hypothetical protein
MAEVIHILPDEKPPEDQDWVLLERTPSGRFVGNGSAAHAPNVTFRIFPPEDWDDAIAEAVAWADRHGIPAVHVRGRENDA